MTIAIALLAFCLWDDDNWKTWVSIILIMIIAFIDCGFSLSYVDDWEFERGNAIVPSKLPGIPASQYTVMAIGSNYAIVTDTTTTNSPERLWLIKLHLPNKIQVGKKYTIGVVSGVPWPDGVIWNNDTFTNITVPQASN